jgi:hypothetical protein
MALVNSDLFLVQDAVTKTNYKVSFQNLASQIDTDVNLDGRVAVSGDNMTGNLTLGTNRIILNADGGQGSFKGNVEVGDFSNDQGILLNKDGYIDCNRGAVSHSIYRGKLNGSVTINLLASGNATFVGDVTANAFAGDGSALTNLPVEPGLWVENGNDLSPIRAGNNLTSIADITLSGDLAGVNGVFSGTLEADSVDGGTYS